MRNAGRWRGWWGDGDMPPVCYISTGPHMGAKLLGKYISSHSISRFRID